MRDNNENNSVNREDKKFIFEIIKKTSNGERILLNRKLWSMFKNDNIR